MPERTIEIRQLFMTMPEEEVIVQMMMFFNDKGHTEVGDLGWMKYTDKLYNNNTIDIEERPSR